jgi:DUF971 family protein
VPKKLTVPRIARLRRMATAGLRLPSSSVSVKAIDIERHRSVTVTFDDGHVCVFALDELRRVCPCATCRSWRDQGQASWPRPGSPDTLSVEGADLVGAWGLSITWNDGHSTGIYPWDSLRRWCDADARGDLPGASGPSVA